MFWLTLSRFAFRLGEDSDETVSNAKSFLLLACLFILLICRRTLEAFPIAINSSKLEISLLKWGPTSPEQLAVASQPHQLVIAVCCSLGWSELGGPLALCQQATCLSSCSSEPTQFTVLHCILANPIDAGIITDDFVEWINHDHFKPFVNCICCNPIGIQDSESTTFSPNSFLSNAA